MARQTNPQDRAIKVLVALIKSHQAILGYVRSDFCLHTPTNLRAADDAIDAAGKLLNDLRLGEVKMVRWVPVTTLWCIECGNGWEEGQDGEDCPECGGQGSDA